MNISVKIKVASLLIVLGMFLLPWCCIAGPCNLASHDVVTVTSITATGATKITKIKGDSKIIHFVTPKGGAEDKVTLTITLSHDTQANRGEIEWVGATEDPENPLKATVSKSTAAKHIVKIKVDGGTCVFEEIRVWVVWATATATETTPPYVNRGNITDQHSPSQSGPGSQVKTRWDFYFTIQPLSILADANRPDFTGAKTTSPPAGTHFASGRPFSSGADKKWDVSRRVRGKMLSPNVGSEWFRINTGSAYTGLPSAQKISVSYPSNTVMGNDDTSTADEINIPNAQGKVWSADAPGYPTLRDAGGNIGDTVENRGHFGEFLRLEIEGVWCRVSDFVNWRFHSKLIKADESADNLDHNGDGDKLDQLWINNGSIGDATNNGW